MNGKNKLRVTEATKYTASIDDYFEDAAVIWARDVSERSVLDLWLHVVDHCTRLVEAVRKEKPRDVIDDLADTVMWLFSLLAQLRGSNNPIDSPFRIDKSPSELIWNKYPAYCPACLDFQFTGIISSSSAETAGKAMEDTRDNVDQWINDTSDRVDGPTPCQCLSRIAFAEERHQKFKDITPALDDYRLQYAEAMRVKGKSRSGMLDLEGMFDGIFGHSYQVFSVQNIAFHLLEEVGEVSQALKDCYTFDAVREPFSQDALKRRKMKLEEEIADVFSWIHALMLKIRHVYYEDAQEYFKSLLSGQKFISVDFEALVKSIALPNIIWAKYGIGRNGTIRSTLCCAACYESPCACQRQLQIDWSTHGSA